MANPELPVPDGLKLRPFHGVRYTVGDVARVTSPPYDLIGEDDARALLSSHPNNVVRLILPGADRHRYAEARDTLSAWLAEGVLAADPEPAIYVYEQSAGDRVLQRGLIGDVALTPPERRIILPHEDVMPGPVADRLALMRTTQANLEPIFLLYEGGESTARLLTEVATTRAPVTDVVVEDGNGGPGPARRHRLWAITDASEIALLNDDLRDRQALIADGHHRYATYLELQREHHAAGDGPGPWDYGLALLVDSTAYPPDLKPIHRVIPGLPLAQAVARAKGAWQVHEYAVRAEGLAALATAPEPAYLLAGAGGPAHLLTDPDPLQLRHAMPADRSAQWQALNTSILAEFLLPKVWGLHDDERTVRIVHHDPDAAIRQAASTGGTAVILNPLSVDDVLGVAAEGERVPRKSTSFGPKPRTGLIMRTFAND
ncbi:uncharacterized protein (DUF1015 family) [Thermocatellispora tengchongensis]|uniref:Uncharacterized protein (DUF1015 family) n=2 Tax=Thermocatellispora tengchongensis TaxID=1073253 RepID=A0A840P8L2_9ACTN|nr:DUF1015 domain-containing protein [Thermocatellispora tengchongensis]MBB5136008.1 uncharacterized protein (DUF1015 family) [Thermocatellispora tengchongensis]